MKISIGNDHAGVEYKKSISKILKKKGVKIYNHGTDDKKSVDYPDFIHPVAREVEKKQSDFGIIICGSGNGAAMTANKHKQIRAAICWNKKITILSRQHNNANIISLPARFLKKEKVIELVELFISTEFEGGRHQNRIKKIPCS